MADTTVTKATDIHQAVGLLALGKTSLTYALGGFAYKGIALLSVPLLARLLTPIELGLLDLAAVMASLFGLVVILGTDQGVAFLEPRATRQDAMWESALAVIVIACAILFAFAAALQRPLASLLTGDEANSPVIVAAAAYGIVIALTATTLNAVRLRGSPRAYALASFAIVAAEMAAALAIAWLMPGAVTLMVIGWAVAAVVVALPVLTRHLPPIRRPNAATARRLVAYGMPLVPAVIAWIIGDAWIRSTVARDLDLGSVGAYGIGYRMASVVGLAVTGFGVAWHPYIYRGPSNAVIPRARGALPALVLALGAMAAALTALSPELIELVAGPGYAAARSAVAGLTGGMVAMGVFVLASAVVGAGGATGKVAVAAIVGTSVQAVLAIALVSPLGLAGAGLASVLGYIVAAMILLVGQPALIRGQAGAQFGGAVITATLALLIADVSLSWAFPVRLAMVAAAGVVAAMVLRNLLRLRGVAT